MSDGLAESPSSASGTDGLWFADDCAPQEMPLYLPERDNHDGLTGFSDNLNGNTAPGFRWQILPRTLELAGGDP
jgi:hypothetical protein